MSGFRKGKGFCFWKSQDKGWTLILKINKSMSKSMWSKILFNPVKVYAFLEHSLKAFQRKSWRVLLVVIANWWKNIDQILITFLIFTKWELHFVSVMFFACQVTIVTNILLRFSANVNKIFKEHFSDLPLLCVCLQSGWWWGL